jgi:serine/threonine-protein kinase
MIGTLLSNRYRLERKLGSGGMSTVYLAIDEVLGRKVAVKVLHREISDQPDQIERFRREARAVAQLSHPNLVGVIDAGEDGGYPYIVFEFVDGETLKDRIADVGRLPTDEATAYAIEIGRGLAAAHAARLIHRDVKPQNVLIDSDGRAKITDFGIARSLESHGLTATGRVLGTTDYVSPEQAMGKEVDARTDVYSLGVVLFEMLTGDVPFKAETQVGVAMKHVNELMPDVQERRPEVSAALAAALDRATAKQPSDRYRDMTECRGDREGALEVEVSRSGGATTGEATTVLRSVPAKRRWLPSRRRMSWAGVVVLVLAAAAAIAIAAFSGGGGNSEKPATAPEPTAATLEITSVEDYDPQGGDGEHADTIANIIDDDEATSWTTETYEAGLEGAPKTGVGFVLGTDGSVPASDLTMQTNGGSWSFDVYGSAEKKPPAEPPVDEAGTETGTWGTPLATDQPANKNTEATLEGTPEGTRWYLVWITDLNGVQAAEVFGAQLASAS